MFRDRTSGKIVLFQKPNALLWLFLLAAAFRYGLTFFDASNQLQRISRFVMFGFLGLWAVDELLRGVNPFRRLLGAGILIFIAVSLWTMF